MTRQPVKSTLFKSIGFELLPADPEATEAKTPTTGILEVEEMDGKKYHFANITQIGFNGLMGATSIDRHYNDHIRLFPMAFPRILIP